MTRILLVLTVGLILSCESDDDNQANESSFATDIIGVWELTSVTSNGEELIEFPDCLDRITVTETTYDYTEYFDFSDGNGCVLVSGQVPSPETYTLNGSTFSVSDDGESYVYEITQLNSTALKLQEVYGRA